jgi:hypothetical protein
VLDEDKSPTDEFDDDPPTREIPRETMQALVFGVGYNRDRSA